MLKSVLAIVAGWVLTVALVMLSMAVLAIIFYGGFAVDIPEGETMSSSFVFANLATSFIAAMAGGYLTAHLAPRAGLIHAGILAAINLVLSIPMVLAGALDSQPSWYPLAIAIIGVIGVVDGAFIWKFVGSGRKTLAHNLSSS